MDRARREAIAIKNTEDLLAVVFASRA